MRIVYVICGEDILQHVEFTQLQHDETEVGWLGAKELDLLHLDSKQILVKHAHVQAVGLVDQLCCLLPVVDEMHVRPLPLIFTSLTIHRVVHELVEIFFHIVLRRGTHGGVHRDVGLHPGRL